MSKRALVGLAVLGWLAAAPLAAQTGSDALIDALKNPSTRTRIDALHSLGDAARAEAAVPMAALLLDGNDDVQFAAIESLLKIYAVRADLAQRPWGVTSIGRTSTLPELAFEAGPLATIPAAVPGEVLVNFCSVMRQDESSRIRFAAAYALGVLASPAMGPMNASAQPMVIADVVSGLTHQDAATRQVIARVAGRVFAPNEGASAPAAVGDALITAMNDKDALVRRWAMDSLGWLKFEHAVQALTDRASYYGKNEEGAGALHAVARIASSGSAPVLRALLANTYIPFRLLSIEGLGRIGDQGSLPAINESATRCQRRGRCPRGLVRAVHARPGGRRRDRGCAGAPGHRRAGQGVPGRDRGAQARRHPRAAAHAQSLDAHACAWRFLARAGMSTRSRRSSRC